MPGVSVIIPCYNLGQYLDEAVDSVLAQTYRDFEIIIVNDGSTDEFTNRLLADYDKPKTRVLTTRNQGLSAARNNGIRIAAGEYICCLDADDKYHPQFLEKTVRILDADSNRSVGFVTTFVQVFGESEDIWHCSDYRPFRLVVENLIQVASLFRRECWEKVGGYATNLTAYEDWNFWLAIVGRGYEWRSIREPLFFYRDRPGSMMKRAEAERLELKRTVNANNLDFIRDHLLDVLTEYDHDHYTFADFYRSARETISHLESTVGGLQKELATVYDSQTYRFGTLFRDARSSKRLLFLLPLRVIWFLVPERLKSRVRHWYRKSTPVVKKKQNKKWPDGKPLVSIVVYDAATVDDLESLTDAVLKQTFQRFEMLITETDPDYADQMARIRRKDPDRIVFVKSDHDSSMEWMNSAIAKARGRYICCLSAFSRPVSTWLEKSLYFLEKDGLDVAFSWIEAEGFPETQEAALRAILERNRIPDEAVFRKKTWNRIGGFEETETDQELAFWMFWTNALARGYRFKAISELFFSYEQEQKDASEKNRPTDRQKDLIEKEKQRFLSRRNLKKLQIIDQKQYQVDQPFVNLIPSKSTEVQRVLFALPFVMMGGADTVLLSVTRFLKRQNIETYHMTTLRTDDRYGDNTLKYESIGDGIYHLPRFLENEDDFRRFVRYFMAATPISAMLLAGSDFFYHMLPEIKERCPEIKVLDLLFNEEGHMANNRRYSRYIDLNIVENRRVREVLIHEHGESPDRVRLIPNGVDVHGRFSPERISSQRISELRAEYGIPEKAFVISYLGRFSEEKCPEMLVAVAEKLMDDPRFFFTGAGQGPLHESVVDQVAEKGLQNRVLLPGIVDATSLLAMTDVVLLPSRLDGRPNVVMESLSMGVPVVASRIGGVPEMVLDGENGILCEPGETDEFVAAIRRLADDPDLYRRFRERARSHAMNSFDMKSMNQAYFQVFQDLLNIKENHAA